MDRAKCIGCKKCLAVGCPAVQLKDGKVVHRPGTHVRCTVCAQVCPMHAINRKEGEPCGQNCSFLAGVGGQGQYSRRRCSSRGCCARGVRLKMSEVHGKSQRGGSVTTQLRFSEHVHSPVIGKARRTYSSRLRRRRLCDMPTSSKPDGIAVINDYEMASAATATGPNRIPLRLHRSNGAHVLVPHTARGGDCRGARQSEVHEHCSLRRAGQSARAGRHRLGERHTRHCAGKFVALNLAAYRAGLSLCKPIRIA